MMTFKNIQNREATKKQLYKNSPTSPPGALLQHQQGVVDQPPAFRHGSAVHLRLEIPLRAGQVHNAQQPRDGTEGTGRKVQLQDAVRPGRCLMGHRS